MGKKKLDNLGVSAFCESMSMMIKSGFQIDEAIALLRQGEDCVGLLERVLPLMQKEAEQGKRLSDVMESADIFPAYAVQMVGAGDVTGRLEGTLVQLSKYYVDQKVMGEKLKNAAIYPAILLFAAIAVLTAMLAMVLPAFTDVYNNLVGSLAASSYSYINWAYMLCRISLMVTVLLTGFVLIGFAMWQGKGRRVVERLLGKLPLCAPIMETLGVFRFISSLSAYLSSGATQDFAVAESMKTVFHESVESKIQGCMKRMEEGHGIAQSAYKERLFEPIYSRMLLAGERSGSLEDVLRKLSELLKAHYMGKIDHLVGIVDPLLSCMLILTVGFSLLCAMLPLIGIMNAIG